MSSAEAAWTPDRATRERSNLYGLMKEVGRHDYTALHRWSVEERPAFWEKTLARLGIVFDERPRQVLDLAKGVRDPQWLPGARLEITRSCFGAPADRTAILFGREAGGPLEETSYGQLEVLVDRFAAGVAAHGFAKDDAIALYMPMTPECVAAYLGTVRAGCRVVSVADSFSPDELKKRMRIAGARAVVTVSSYQRGGRTIPLYDKVREARTGERAIVIEPGALDGADLAWEDVLSDGPGRRHVAEPTHVTNVLFSSGTTGDPKAIPWTQLTPLKCAMDGHFHQDIHEGEVVCWPTNIGWMMGPWLIYATLVNRATMALYEGAPTGRGFTDFVHDTGVSMLGVVPSMVKAWRMAGSVEAGEWPSVRVFSSTGEASNADDYRWLMDRADPTAPVIEYLGGTEIGGGHITGTVLQPASPATFTTPALGTRFVVLDEDGAEVPEGATGELFLVPPALGLSQALLNRDHDAVYYAGCPAGPNGEVLRRHGDQIARLAGGRFKAQGRADDTMNLGGIKVASVELERVVDDHPAVYESAAIAVPPAGGGAERLVLCVVLESDADPEALRRDLSRRIAERLNPLFKVHDVVPMETLPRTASNKVMRRQLRRRYAEDAEPPRSRRCSQ